MYVDEMARRELDRILDDVRGGSATNDTGELLRQLAEQLIDPDKPVKGINAADLPKLVMQRSLWLIQGIEGLRDLLRRDFDAESRSQMSRLIRENRALETLVESLRACILAPERERSLLEANNRYLQRARDAEARLRKHGIAYPEKTVHAAQSLREASTVSARPLMLPCESCDATGNATPGGGRNNKMDDCKRCGGTGMMPARTGETPHTSAPPDGIMPRRNTTVIE